MLHKVHKDVGIVFQDPSSSLNPRLPIGQSIGEPILLSRSGARREARRPRRGAARLPSSCRASYRNRYPHELSGGQKQRVGIARALALEPKLLDRRRADLRARRVGPGDASSSCCASCRRDLGFACLFISHDLAVVDSLADRIIVMHHGRIVEQGATGQILRAPQEAYTQRLIAAVPVPDPGRAARPPRGARRAPRRAGVAQAPDPSHLEAPSPG